MPPEPVAVSFANTRTSARRDRIDVLARWRTWVDAWPGLRMQGRLLNADGLVALRATRDDLQLLLRGAATGHEPEPAVLARVSDAVHVAPAPDVRWRGGRLVLAAPGGVAPATAVGAHLAHATLGVLLTGPPLAACEGNGCLRVFVATRPDRRWCDSAVCGNRARVRAHAHRAARDAT